MSRSNDSLCLGPVGIGRCTTNCTLRAAVFLTALVSALSKACRGWKVGALRDLLRLGALPPCDAVFRAHWYAGTHSDLAFQAEPLVNYGFVGAAAGPTAHFELEIHARKDRQLTDLMGFLVTVQRA